ncbi:MAG: GGDEF domain-containing protein [Gordonibacter pamelaeae]|uniref:GGDEF domain-containing protein n=2 Tax=Gordonibacter pamelaeae TaxID=471189 RepID=A0A369M529_9ACTN|nr:GGDEF domain-containing protein [Gordonibacter pamelaeae]MBS4896103.1 GGDEF domain-containing protein [Gordonibacter pamelaeae]MCB6312838.1 GGDEF domain-containing protein [Gordonibacter pamelaeae]RDB65575.1 hypothetical protein C1877_05415 [Gordonibacter pamelaeae]HJH74692.1 GGDEF domain-containing protein [Eggerthellaceae bacterium]
MAAPAAIAATVVLAVCAALAGWGLVRRLGIGGDGRRFPPVLLAVLLAAWGSAASLAAVPLVVLCAGAWAAFALAFCLASGRAAHGLFAANLVFSCFAVSVLLVFSAASILVGGMPWQVVEDDSLRPAVLAAGLALFCGAALAFRGLLDRFPLDAEGGRSYAALFWFGWFSLAYILFDALPSLFRLDVPLLSEFLGASMLLLGVSVAAFVVATSLLGRDAHVEEEYLALMERRERQEARLGQLRDQASRDALTGLRTVEDLLEHGRPFAVAYLDMNGLKAVNDTFGHEAGDACLVRLADALRSSFPGRAALCRMSGDEFLVVLPEGDEREVGRHAGEALEVLAAQPVEGVGAVSFSFGTAASGCEGESAAALVARADRAMYQSKRAYHGRVSGGAR